MKRALFCILVVMGFSLSQSNGQALAGIDLKKLSEQMAGEFSSERQAKEDTTYFNIMLRMMPIWKNRSDGYWFYVEQSMASKQEKPYRQRVYHLYMDNDSTVVSKVFEIKNPARFIMGWKEPSMLAALSPDSLIDRQGCAIHLHKRGKGVFTGTTPGKECLSSLRGALYATSEVTIYPDRLVSWDRGWDKDNKQVWGAEKGGYIFIKHRKFK